MAEPFETPIPHGNSGTMISHRTRGQRQSSAYGYRGLCGALSGHSSLSRRKWATVKSSYNAYAFAKRIQLRPILLP